MYFSIQDGLSMVSSLRLCRSQSVGTGVGLRPFECTRRRSEARNGQVLRSGAGLFLLVALLIQTLNFLGSAVGAPSLLQGTP